MLVAQEVEELVRWPRCPHAADVERVVGRVACRVGDPWVQRSAELMNVSYETSDFVFSPSIERREDCSAGHVIVPGVRVL
eukprot:8146168-Alexandrium_andersonii.AAC.1